MKAVRADRTQAAKFIRALGIKHALVASEEDNSIKFRAPENCAKIFGKLAKLEVTGDWFEYFAFATDRKPKTELKPLALIPGQTGCRKYKGRAEVDFAHFAVVQPGGNRAVKACWSIYLVRESATQTNIELTVEEF